MKVMLVNIDKKVTIECVEYVHYKDNVNGEYGFLPNHDKLLLDVNHGTIICQTKSAKLSYKVARGLLSINKNVICFIGQDYEPSSDSRIAV